MSDDALMELEPTSSNQSIMESEESGTSVSAAARRPSVSEIEKWRVEDIIAYLREVYPDISEKTVGILEVNEINGRALLKLTEEKLMQDGLVRGPAIVIAQHVQELRESMPVAKKARIETLSSVLKGQELKPQHNLPKFSHNFYDRQRYIKEVMPVFSSNYRLHGKYDHKDHKMILVPGGSGIGKSRSGWELQHLISHAESLGFTFEGVSEIDLFQKALQNPYYFCIDLNNGYAYDQRFDENLNGTRRMGTRLAAASGLIPDIMGEYPVHLFKTPDVMREILKRRYKASDCTLHVFIIHIDEYQVYIERAQTKRSWNDAREFFKDMLKAIGNIMRDNISIDGHLDKKYFVVPICTGTSAIDVHFLPSDHTGVVISLKPLDYKSAVEMFRDKYEYSRQTTDVEKKDAEQSVMQHYGSSISDTISNLSTKLCNLILEEQHFHIALWDTGFIPKFIHDFLQPNILAIEYNWGRALHTNMSLRPINMADQPGCWRSLEDIRVVISYGLTQLTVSRKFLLPSKTSIGEVERAGLIYLTKAPEASDTDIMSVTITMPLMLLKILNNELRNTSEGCIIPDDLLLIPSFHRPWQWQDFEDLHGHYQSALIAALINIKDAKILASKDSIEQLYKDWKSEKGQTATKIKAEIRKEEKLLAEAKESNWCLSDVFRGAKGDACLLKKKVILCKKKVFTEKKKFLKLTTDIAPASTTILCSDNHTRKLMDGIYHCAINNANLDHRWALQSISGKPLAIFMQDKHSLLETDYPKVTYNDVKKWYKATLQSVSRYQEQYDVVLVYFTNRVYFGTSDLSEMPRLLLIDSTCIEEYLSPTFAHRGLVQLGNYEPE